jgi:DNA-binding NtrC family response regulator
LRQKSIIIIDDELLIRDLLYDFFADKDWDVSVFDSGIRALEAIKNRAFDVALVDIKMPETDGMAFIKRLKDFSPDMPVLLMTAFPSVETAVEALHLKIDDYIIKPFNINRLFKTIDGLVDQRRSKAEAESPQRLHI